MDTDLPLLGRISGKAMDAINNALWKGCKFRAFRSGGGLRVVTVERHNIDKGYGEDPNIENALEQAAKSLTKVKPYECVYLTGTTQASSRLDRWVLGGSTFRAYHEGRALCVELHGWGRHELPEGVMSRVLHDGEVVSYTSDRGFTYESSRSYFPGNGEACVQTRLVDKPSNRLEHRAWLWRMFKTGRGDTFLAALENAFNAPEVEKEEE